MFPEPAPPPPPPPATTSTLTELTPAGTIHVPFEVNIIGLDIFIKVAVTDLLLSMMIVAGLVVPDRLPDQLENVHPLAGEALT
jgi:hypothetical protein